MAEMGLQVPASKDMQRALEQWEKMQNEEESSEIIYVVSGAGTGDFCLFLFPVPLCDSGGNLHPCIPDRTR